MSNLRRDARCLIRQREPIQCWQLCFPTRFNELHKVARHASRRSFRFLSKPVAPIAKQLHYKGCARIPEIDARNGIISPALWLPTLSESLESRQVVPGEILIYGRKPF